MGDGYTSLIKLRVTPEQKAWLQEHADKRGMSKFIRDQLFEEPHETILLTKGSPNPDLPPHPPAESRTSPKPHYDDDTAIAPTEKLQRTIRLKMAQGKTSKLAEIEAREELGL